MLHHRRRLVELPFRTRREASVWDFGVYLTMAKEPRKRTPPEIELSVLDKSRRRCALCFQFAGDLTEKRGQIAHMDDNPANYAEDNLAFFCLDHHSVFDSKT